MIPAAALAIETSTRAGSIALFRSGGDPLLLSLGEGSAHGSGLAPAIEDLLAGAGLVPSGLELVVCGLGPGSYTGLRVGAATALGLSLGTGCPLFGISSLAAVAAAAGREGEVLFTAAPAGGENCYCAAFLLRDGTIREEVPHAVQSWDDAAAQVRGGWLLAGEGAARLAALTDAPVAGGGRDREPGARGAPDRPITSNGPAGTGRPDAIAVGRLGIALFDREGPTDPADFKPLYLRKSSAEINWEANRKRNG